MPFNNTLNISDSSGTEYVCTIALFADDYIELTINEKLKCDTELGIKLVLFQGLPKKDKIANVKLSAEAISSISGV